MAPWGVPSSPELDGTPHDGAGTSIFLKHKISACLKLTSPWSNTCAGIHHPIPWGKRYFFVQGTFDRDMEALFLPCLVRRKRFD